MDALLDSFYILYKISSVFFIIIILVCSVLITMGVFDHCWNEEKDEEEND